LPKCVFGKILKIKFMPKRAFFFFFLKKNLKALFVKYDFKHALNQSKKEKRKRKKRGIFFIWFNPFGVGNSWGKLLFFSRINRCIFVFLRNLYEHFFFFSLAFEDINNILVVWGDIVLIETLRGTLPIE
jgi:hypothetical protein